jgi:hypothetical protein
MSTFAVLTASAIVISFAVCSQVAGAAPSGVHHRDTSTAQADDWPWAKATPAPDAR